jgi:uncharacterized protein (TIGR02270 family)
MQEVHIDLYREHLEEASFLYQQRLHLLNDNDMPWTALHDFEERLEAHIDALVVGSELALNVCRAQAAEGDAGELFAAVSVFCRQLKAAGLSEVLKHPGTAEPDHAQALVDALKRELPEAWNGNFLRAMEQGGKALSPMMATVVGHRRIDSGGLLSRMLQGPDPSVNPTWMWALGRTAEAGASVAIRAQLQAKGLPMGNEAALALLRLQDPEISQELLQAPASADRHAQLIALGGGRLCTTNLLADLKKSAPHVDVLQALGLLGDLAAVRPLLRCLDVEDMAGHAAEALHVITGAALFEEVFVPEKVEEDELLEDEALQYRQTGQLLAPANGSSPGARVRRLCQDAAIWEEWLKSNAGRFVAHRRFRHGQPMGPDVLLRCLASTDYPKSYRKWLAEELLISYAIDLPLEIDMPVSQQRSVLRQAAPSIMAASAMFEPGRWYVAGRILEPS